MPGNTVNEKNPQSVMGAGNSEKVIIHLKPIKDGWKHYLLKVWAIFREVLQRHKAGVFLLPIGRVHIEGQ